jgi:hypothetical protein
LNQNFTLQRSFFGQIEFSGAAAKDFFALNASWIAPGAFLGVD